MISQQTPEWLEQKRTRIGGSEIYALASYYCKPELESIGVDLIKDQPFQSALELYLRVKFGVEQEPIPVVSSEFGGGIEPYIVARLNIENSDFKTEGTKDFIIAENIHKLACCSPDGYIDIEIGQILRDFDDKQDISKNMGKGTLELKTTPYAFNFQSEEGPKFQYIFQLMYNAMLLDHKWGILACLTPKEKEYDTDFHKGKMLGMLQFKDAFTAFDLSETTIVHMNKCYNLYTYVYTAIKPIQDICMLALNRFQKALDENKLPNISRDNKIKLIREKKMLAKVHQERFDTLKADKVLDNLLNERDIISKELLKVASEKEAIDCDIIKRMGDHIELEGSNIRAKFDSRGSLRFSKMRRPA